MSSVPPQLGPLSHALDGGGSSSVWPDDLVDRLKALWADDSLTAAVIASRLGVSRNAVLGKVHRLGLSNRRKSAGSRPARTPRPPRAPRAVRPPHPALLLPGLRAPRPSPAPKPPLPVVDVGPGLIARLEDLPRHGCHWPVGDPAAADFRFCGRATVRAPYCEGHRLVAYKPGGARPVAKLLKGCAGA